MASSNFLNIKKISTSRLTPEYSAELNKLLSESVAKAESLVKDIDKGLGVDPLRGTVESAGEYRFAAQYAEKLRDFRLAIRYAEKSRDLYRKAGSLADREKNDGSVYRQEAETSLKYVQRLQSHHKSKNLLTKIIGSFLISISLFYFSPILTGNVIGSLPQNSTNVIGIILFLLGLVLFYHPTKK